MKFPKVELTHQSLETEKGKLVSMGMATEAPTEELKAAVSETSLLSSAEKILSVKGEFAIAAGATAFVVYNNAPVLLSQWAVLAS